MNSDEAATGYSGVDLLDRRDGLVYVPPEGILLAVKAALATGRPLLLRGDPGSGKSTLAAYVARSRDWRYYEHVVTSRTQARELLWTFDSVRRLGDAQVRAQGSELNDADYVKPGVLWWAFAPESARLQATDPNHAVNKDRLPDRAVVLIDEIDKADPDMPNGLLVPLGSSEFDVTETDQVVTKEPAVSLDDDGGSRHLIIITTNEERELPQAFLRRCVVAWLEQPLGEQLIEIAKAHLDTYDGGYTTQDIELIGALVDAFAKSRVHAQEADIRRPSTAEFLDALRACRKLGITVGSDEWKLLSELTLTKPPRQSVG